MNIKVLFQKEGLVSVGTNDQNQTVNMLNPIGTPININFNFQTGIVTMTIKSWDDRNEIVRDFDLEIPIEAWQEFLMTTFTNYIHPIAKETYTEFDGLTELELIIK